MKRMMWIAAMLVLSLVSLAMRPAKEIATLQSPPFECGASCSRDMQCTIQCSTCGDDPFDLEPGNVCFWDP